MDGQLYFEEHPWLRACRVAAEKKIGAVEQIVAQCVCTQGTLEENLTLWKQRVAGLAGPEQEGNLLRGAHALSYIGKFGGGTIVRLFLDDAADDLSENFEIVTKTALIVWKPINTNQAHAMADGSYFIESRQHYVADLADGCSIDC